MKSKISIAKSIFFTCTVVALTLCVFPVAAQINPIVAGDCGFGGVPCTSDDSIGGTITPAIYSALRALFGLLLAVSVVYLMYAGVLYISSGGDIERASTAKRQIIYAIIGIIVFTSAEAIAVAIQTGLTNSNITTTLLLAIIDPYIGIAQVLIPIVAVIYLMYGGYKYINSQGSTESAEAAKRQIIYAILGLIVAILSSVIVDATVTRDVSDLSNDIYSFVNPALGIVALAAAGYLVLAGVMYISSQGDSDKAQRAKMQIIYAGIGIIVISLSAVIVNFFIRAS